MTGQALTLPGLDALLLRAQERPVRFLARGTRVRHATHGRTATVVRTEHRPVIDRRPGSRFVVVDVDGDLLSPAHRPAWIDQLVEEDTDR